MFTPLRSAFKQVRENLVTVDQLTALGLSKPVFNLPGNLGTIASQPVFLFVEHLGYFTTTFTSLSGTEITLTTCLPAR